MAAAIPTDERTKFWTQVLRKLCNPHNISKVFKSDSSSIADFIVKAEPLAFFSSMFPSTAINSCEITSHCIPCKCFFALEWPRALASHAKR